MHILILPSEYPTEDHKLGGIFTQEQEKFLSKKNKLGVIYIYLFSIKFFFSSLIFKTLRLEKKSNRKFFFYFPRIPYFKIINYYLHYYFFLFVFKKYLRSNGKPDLLHVHFSEFSIWTAYKIKKLYKIPYILTEHSTDFLDGRYEKSYKKNSIVYNQISLALNNAKKIICVSSSLKKKIKRIYKLKDSKLVIIPNLSINISYNKKEKNNDIIFVGSLEKRKNPILLLKAFKQIYKNKLSMKIIGNGELKQEVYNFIKNHKLDKYVKVYTNLQRKSVLKMIARSRVLVLPSFYETFGVVVIEAYSVGVPVVMTDSQGVRDLYKQNCSILVKKIEVNNLGEAILKILNNYKRYKYKTIINYYKKNFSPSLVVNKIEKLYRS